MITQKGLGKRLYCQINGSISTEYIVIIIIIIIIVCRLHFGFIFTMWTIIFQPLVQPTSTSHLLGFIIAQVSSGFQYAILAIAFPFFVFPKLLFQINFFAYYMVKVIMSQLETTCSCYEFCEEWYLAYLIFVSPWIPSSVCRIPFLNNFSMI